MVEHVTVAAQAREAGPSFWAIILALIWLLVEALKLIRSIVDGNSKHTAVMNEILEVRGIAEGAKQAAESDNRKTADLTERLEEKDVLTPRPYRQLMPESAITRHGVVIPGKPIPKDEDE